MKYEITDKVIYTTTQFMIEHEDGREYRVSLTENDGYEHYRVIDENDDVIDHDDPLYDLLVTLCEENLNDNL